MSGTWWRRASGAARWLAMAAVLGALALGVGDRDAPQATRLPPLDLVVVVDRTTSMSALDDPAGSRITAARQDLTTLGENLESARFTLVTVGAKAQVVLPATSDRIAFEDAVAALQVEPAAAGTGSAPSRFVPLVQRLVDRIDASERLPVLVYVGDGEQTSDWDRSLLVRLRARFSAAAVLGYGTQAGGVMPLARVPVDARPPSVAAAGPLVPDVTTGEPAISRTDPDVLSEIARQVGGIYVQCDGTQDIAAVAQTLERRAYDDLEPAPAARQMGWLWALLLLLLGLVELRIGWRQWLEARREGRS